MFCWACILSTFAFIFNLCNLGSSPSSERTSICVGVLAKPQTHSDWFSLWWAGRAEPHAGHHAGQASSVCRMLYKRDFIDSRLPAQEVGLPLPFCRRGNRGSGKRPGGDHSANTWLSWDSEPGPSACVLSL